MVIVVGVDDSELAKTVLERAIDETERRQGELRVVHVVHLPTYIEFPVDVMALVAAEREAVWGPLRETIERAGVALQKVDLEGYPPDALVEYAEAVEASLLVLGTRGRGDLASLILGSTSHRALQGAGCDVLVIKPRRNGS
jgi:nucleotide-binding universal stress UspA family protein